MAIAVASTHLVFSVAATLVAVAIAVAGLALIVQAKWLWYGSMLIAGSGLVAMIGGLLGHYT